VEVEATEATDGLAGAPARGVLVRASLKILALPVGVPPGPVGSRHAIRPGAESCE
jgi:hypothetical protein